LSVTHQKKQLNEIGGSNGIAVLYLQEELLQNETLAHRKRKTKTLSKTTLSYYVKEKQLQYGKPAT
jgi:hypothetical protein